MTDDVEAEGQDDDFSQEELRAADGDEVDAGSEGSEGDVGDEDAPEQPGPGKAGDEPSEEGRQVGRATGRFHRVREKLVAERTRNEELQRRLASLESQQARAPNPQTEAEEQARVAAMDPMQRMAYELDKSNKYHQQEMQRVQFLMHDQSDQNSFAQRQQSDARARRYAQDVEKTLAEFRRAGFNPKRELIYAFLVGQKVISNKAAPAKQAAAQRVKNQTVRPGSVASDAQKPSGKGKSLEARLSGVTF